MKSILMLTVTAAVLLNAGDSRGALADQLEDLTIQVTEAKEDAAKALSAVEKLKKKGLQFGFSVGVTSIMSPDDDLMTEVVVSPVDNTLAADQRDRKSITLSAVVMTFPFGEESPWGFLANVDIAEFSETESTFNKSIEGGIGFAYRVSESFTLGVTYERIASRQMRSFLEVGKPVVVGGETLTEIALDDDRFFFDDNLSALSLKFVFKM